MGINSIEDTLTLSLTKQHLMVDIDDDDELIESYLIASRNFVQHYLGKNVVTFAPCGPAPFCLVPWWRGLTGPYFHGNLRIQQDQHNQKHQHKGGIEYGQEDRGDVLPAYLRRSGLLQG